MKIPPMPCYQLRFSSFHFQLTFPFSHFSSSFWATILVLHDIHLNPERKKSDLFLDECMVRKVLVTFWFGGFEKRWGSFGQSWSLELDFFFLLSELGISSSSCKVVVLTIDGIEGLDQRRTWADYQKTTWRTFVNTYSALKGQAISTEELFDS
jgi:hypothetical protein